MSTFALIHGAHHGGWCWDFFVPELEARGHSAVAVDLPADDPTAALTQYATVVTDALAETDDDVVVVGHSLGGITAAVVAAWRPVRRLVFLSAPVPEPGRTFADQRGDEPEINFTSERIDNHDGTWSRDPDVARSAYYHDCDEERREFAIARLRPQSRAPHTEPSPIDALPDIPTNYVLCQDDRAVRPDYQRWTARTRLGIEPIEIPGSHSPFLARPAMLADLLCGLD